MLKKRKTISKSTIVKQESPISKNDMWEKMIIDAVHEATECITKPPKFLMEKLTNMEDQLRDLSKSVEKLKEENNRLTIEVLKHMDYSGGTNMRILELLTLQNNNFAKHLDRIYAPTARRDTPFVIPGTRVLPNTERLL